MPSTFIRYFVRMSAPSSHWQFPIIRAIGRLVTRAWNNWRKRHQDWRNFTIHMLGIPLAVAGLVVLFFLPWYWGVSAIILGYILQWIGHYWEGNDLGEWAAIKRLLGLPVVAISPRFANPAQPHN